MNSKDVAVIMPATNIAQAVDSARRMIAFAGTPLRMIIAHDHVRQGFIKTLNAVAERINAEFIAYVAQDALAGTNWLKIALDKLSAENKCLFAFNDGRFDGELAAFGLVRTAFCAKFYENNHIFYRGYHSHRADDELTQLALLSGQLTYSPDSVLLEVDYKLQREINADDINLYLERKKHFVEMVKKLSSDSGGNTYEKQF